MGALQQLWEDIKASPAADAVRQVQMHGGILPTIYSGADSIKRRLSDALANPGGYIQQTIGNLADHPEAIAGAFMPDGGGLGTIKGTRGFVYPRAAALETARQNGVKMLGLPENNTPMDRAQALGYDMPVFHSSLKDVSAFEPHGEFMGHQGVSGISVTDSPQMASRYLDRYANQGWVDGVPNQPFDKNVAPLMLRSGNMVQAETSPYSRNASTMGHPLPDGYVNPMVADGINTLSISDAISRNGPVKHSDAKNAIRGSELIAADPTQLRSRFAAFDPARINDPDLLAAMPPPARYIAPQDDQNSGPLTQVAQP